MTWILAKIFGYCLGFYVLAAVVFLLTARLGKDSEGRLALDPNSFHFKAAYPFKRRSTRFQEFIRENGISLCRYFSKFLWMLIVVWPLIGIFETIKFCVYNVFTLPFGWYVVPDLYAAYGFPESFLVMKARPYISWKFMPIYFLVPAAYAWSMIYHSSATLHYTEWAGIWLVIIISVISLVCLFVWFTTSEDKGPSLVREWIVAKKKNWCPQLIVKTSAD